MSDAHESDGEIFGTLRWEDQSENSKFCSSSVICTIGLVCFGIFLVFLMRMLHDFRWEQGTRNKEQEHDDDTNSTGNYSKYKVLYIGLNPKSGVF